MLNRKKEGVIDEAAAQRISALRDLNEFMPYLRTGIAILIYLFKDERTIGECYADSRVFTTRIAADLKGEAD